jgi:hypothetical protein
MIDSILEGSSLRVIPVQQQHPLAQRCENEDLHIKTTKPVKYCKPPNPQIREPQTTSWVPWHLSHVVQGGVIANEQVVLEKQVVSEINEPYSSMFGMMSSLMNWATACVDADSCGN